MFYVVQPGGGSVGRTNSVHGLTSTSLVLPGIKNNDGKRYSTSSSSSSSSGSTGRRTCRVYATIREMKSKRSTTVCGGGSSSSGGRQKTVHVSVDHEVEIRIINSHAAPKPLVFVLKFEGFYTFYSTAIFFVSCDKSQTKAALRFLGI